jgi:hypothetical protein
MSHTPKLLAIEALEEGLLSAPGQARIERHLASCTMCRAAREAVHAYQEMRADARALTPPDLAWEELEKALIQEAPETFAPSSARTSRTSVEVQKGRNGRLIALVLPILAVAATVVVGWVGIHNQREEARRIEPKANTVHMEAPRVADAALLRGRVTLVTGKVLAELKGSQRELVPGDDVHEGEKLITDMLGELHVALADGSGFALSPTTDLGLEKLREGEVRLSLASGEVLSEVHTLGPKETYVVHDDTFSAHVRGTRFLVSHRDFFGAEVREGRVEIMRGDASVVLLTAGQRWEAHDVEKADRRREPHVYGVGALHENWATLELPGNPRIAAWQLGDVRVATSGVLRMRAPLGVNAIVLEDLQGKTHPFSVTVMPEGSALSETLVNQALELPRDTAGHLDPSQISPVVRDGLDRLRRCYERSLRTDPKLESKLVLSVRVAGDGHVTRANLEAGLPEDFERCVLNEARTWQFPKPTGGTVSFEVPLNFRAQR